jgi:hypothetical protein
MHERRWRSPWPHAGRYRKGARAESLSLYQELGHKGDMAMLLESFAVIAAVKGAGERAARLLGAAMHEHPGVHVAGDSGQTNPPRSTLSLTTG